MKSKNLLATSIVALTASCWAETAKAFILIDNYNTVNQNIADDNSDALATASTGTGIASNILGAVRDIQVFASDSSPTSTFTTGTIRTANFTSPRGILQFSKDAGSSPIEYRIDYDATPGFSGSGTGGINPSGLGSLNFTSDPSNTGIRFDIIGTNDLGANSFAKLTAYSNAGTIVGFNTINNIESLTAINDLVFLFAGFSNGVNFASISALRLDLTINPQSDGSGGFRPAAISFEQVEVAQIPFEFNPILGISIVGGLWSLNKIRTNKLNATN